MSKLTNNKRKVVNALVWFKDELMAITNQNVGKEHIVLNNLHKVKKSSVRLAKVGDSVKYKDVSILPERCRNRKNIKITYFLDNGLVGTNRDLYKNCDSTAYGHFKKA